MKIVKEEKRIKIDIKGLLGAFLGSDYENGERTAVEEAWSNKYEGEIAEAEGAIEELEKNFKRSDREATGVKKRAKKPGKSGDENRINTVELKKEIQKGIARTPRKAGDERE